MPFEIRLESEPLPAEHPHCLASVAFGCDAPVDTVATYLRPLRSPPLFENWYSLRPVCHRQYEKLSYACNDAILFAHASLCKKCIVKDLEDAYKALMQLLVSQHYVLLRAWHYLPQLSNAADYRIFCTARAQAFLAFKTHFCCAATVIGTDSDRGAVYFIASRHAGTIINNPRQTAPQLYPKHDTASTPLFARAILKRWNYSEHLYISGTAAIVGHKSMHAGDADAQLDEIMRNLKELLNAASKAARRRDTMQLEQLQYPKFYIDKRVSGKIDQQIDKLLGFWPQLQVFEGQICRPELLVEAEAMLLSNRNRDA